MDGFTVAEQPHALGVVWGDLELVRYVYEVDVDGSECPKPFAHPLRTLAGDVLTTYRPHDHRWHTGLFLAFSKVGDDDLWGGPTWVPGDGWQQLDNVGSIRHVAWESVTADARGAELVEAVAWRGRSGERLLSERRTLRAGNVDAERGTWELAAEFVLTNASERDLALSHPAAAGLEGYGYGGLTWRGPRSFEHDSVFFTADRTDEQVHGTHAPWLAFCGAHDEHERSSTIVFVDDPRNPRHPGAWAVWTGDLVQVSCAFHFDEEYVIERGGELTLRYRLVIVDGAWRKGDVEDYLAAAS
jgi:hypothetical protein